MAVALIGLQGVAFSDAYSAVFRPTEYAAAMIAFLIVLSPLLGTGEPDHTIRLKIVRWAVLPTWLFALWVLQGRAVVPFLYFKF